MSHYTKPKILFLDIELAPIIADVWKLWDNNVGLNQIVKDWSIIAYAAKWRGEKKIHYYDTSKQKDLRDDSKILPPLWDLLNECQIAAGQNSKKFDIKKINARFIINGTHGGQPPSDYRQQDTLQMAKKVFGLTSFKLEYMSKALNLKTQKMTKREFAGHELWSECLKGNKKAWREMKAYNIADLLATEELYEKILAWDNSINFNVYHKMHSNVCGCGSTEFTKDGYRPTNAGKYQRFRCVKCGKSHVDRTNELSLKKRKAMLK